MTLQLSPVSNVDKVTPKPLGVLGGVSVTKRMFFGDFRDLIYEFRNV